MNDSNTNAAAENARILLNNLRTCKRDAAAALGSFFNLHDTIKDTADLLLRLLQEGRNADIRGDELAANLDRSFNLFGEAVAKMSEAGTCIKATCHQFRNQRPDAPPPNP
jgi:hypothetical protein